MYKIEDFKNAQAFVVTKDQDNVAFFYYHDHNVPKKLVRRVATVFKNEMNDLSKKIRNDHQHRQYENRI